MRGGICISSLSSLRVPIRTLRRPSGHRAQPLSPKARATYVYRKSWASPLGALAAIRRTRRVSIGRTFGAPIGVQFCGGGMGRTRVVLLARCYPYWPSRPRTYSQVVMSGRLGRSPPQACLNCSNFGSTAAPGRISPHATSLAGAPRKQDRVWYWT